MLNTHLILLNLCKPFLNLFELLFKTSKPFNRLAKFHKPHKPGSCKIFRAWVNSLTEFMFFVFFGNLICHLSFCGAMFKKNWEKKDKKPYNKFFHNFCFYRLGRTNLVVAMSVYILIYLYIFWYICPLSMLFFLGISTHWPSDDMISSRPLVGLPSTSPPSHPHPQKI